MRTALYQEALGLAKNGYSYNNCLAKSVIYQATVKTSDKRPTQRYVGLTENQLKTRHTNHIALFNDLKKRNSTGLSQYI